MNNIHKLLGDRIRLKLIIAMREKSKGGVAVKSNQIINSETLGEIFNQSSKKLQAHLLLIVKSGIFKKAPKRGYYTYNEAPIKEAIKELQNLI